MYEFVYAGCRSTFAASGNFSSTIQYVLNTQIDVIGCGIA
jgi:hypothetical protein